MSESEQPDPGEILNKLPFALFIKNHEGKFTWVNEHFAKLTSANLNDVIGKDDWAFYETPFATKYLKEDEEVLKTGGTTSSHEILHTSGNREASYVRTIKIPLYTENKVTGESKLTGLLGVFVDIGSDENLRAMLDARAKTISQTEQQLSNLVQPDESPRQEPRVFISYKHSSEEHQQWVSKLATDLIEQYNVHCDLDQFDLGFGDSIPAYMQTIQTKATHVLFIITPECARSVESSSGGVSFEMQLATSLRERGRLRIIPVLRAGNQLPAYVQAHLYIDFRDDAIYPDMVRRLADSVRYGKTRPKPNSRRL